LPTVFAGEQLTLDALMALETRPPGVVFEIVSGRQDRLITALPEVAEASRVLRARFPGLPVAVVTHGSEQFALTAANRAEYPAAHRLARIMTEDEDTPVHVCGTHAGWRGVTDEDFPDYVDVAPSGPAQIGLYRELGYLLVVL
jgi:intracellular sulfur oxidation DsrE/DsrF family protein